MTVYLEVRNVPRFQAKDGFWTWTLSVFQVFRNPSVEFVGKLQTLLVNYDNLPVNYDNLLVNYDNLPAKRPGISCKRKKPTREIRYPCSEAIQADPRRFYLEASQDLH